MIYKQVLAAIFLAILFLPVPALSGTFSENFADASRITSYTAEWSPGKIRNGLIPSFTDHFINMQTLFTSADTLIVRSIGYGPDTSLDTLWFFGFNGKKTSYSASGQTWTDITSTISAGSTNTYISQNNGYYWLCAGQNNMQTWSKQNGFVESIDIKANGFTINGGNAAIPYASVWNGSYWLIGGQNAKLMKYKPEPVDDPANAIYTTKDHSAELTMITGLSGVFTSSVTITTDVSAIGWNGSYFLVGGGTCIKTGSQTITQYTSLASFDGESTVESKTSLLTTSPHNITDLAIKQICWNGSYWLIGTNGTADTNPSLLSIDNSLSTATNLSTMLTETGISISELFGINGSINSIIWDSANSMFYIGGRKHLTSTTFAPVLLQYDGAIFRDITSSLNNFTILGKGSVNVISFDGTNMFIGGDYGRLNRTTAMYVPSSSVQSTRITTSITDTGFIGTERITKGTLTPLYGGTNQNAAYYISGDGGTHFESVTPRVEKTLDYSGFDLRWKAVLTGGFGTAVLTNISLNYTAVSKDYLPANQGGDVLADDYAPTNRSKFTVEPLSINKNMIFTMVRDNTKTGCLKAYTLTAVEDAGGTQVNNLEKHVKISIECISTDGINILESAGTIRLADAAAKLAIGYYNGIRWVPLRSLVTVNGNSVIVSANTSHLSTYGLIASASSPIACTAAPNPFTPSSSNPMFNSAVFTFDNMLDAAQLKIYDISGTKVRTISKDFTSSILWDGKNDNGKTMESGVYLYQVTAGGTSVGKGSIVIAK